MTALIANNQIANNIIPSIKVALVGVTMIQQSLLEFYFATLEGAQKYCVVLGKEAEAYITNFDELGSIEAWEHLYAQEKKPTLIISSRHEIINNYIYIPKPLTPKALADAAISIHYLLENRETSDNQKSILVSNDAFQFIVDPATRSLDEKRMTPLDKPAEALVIPTNKSNDDIILPKAEGEEKKINKQTVEFESIDKVSIELDSDKSAFIEELKTEQPLDTFASIEEPTVDTPPPQQVKAIEDINTLEIDEFISFKPSSQQQETEKPPSHKNKETSEDQEDIFEGLDMLDDISFQEDTEEEKITTPDGDISSPDELQLFLDELNDKNSQPQEKKKISKSSDKESKQKIRWNQLCGEYKNSHYKKNSGVNTRFKLEETLLPYIVDTISFTERAKCWMELAYKPLSLFINPESKLIYSNFSLKDPLFVQICNGKAVEELIEYLEVDPEKINQIKAKQLPKKLFTYDIQYFLWTISLLVSHGRLPEKLNPDEGMSVTNWLSLNNVEKFPYIMQIAAVFNQHHASLNDAAVWMKLPKRYVYAFYNGVAALDLIDKKPKKSLIRKS
jgi:hypothetical protein